MVQESSALKFDTGLTWEIPRAAHTKKPLRNIGIPRVLFVAGAGFEPATFGL